MVTVCCYGWRVSFSVFKFTIVAWFPSDFICSMSVRRSLLSCLVVYSLVIKRGQKWWNVLCPSHFSSAITVIHFLPLNSLQIRVQLESAYSFVVFLVPSFQHSELVSTIMNEVTITSEISWLRFCKLENEILKEAKNTKNSHSKTKKNAIFERFSLFQNFVI